MSWLRDLINSGDMGGETLTESLITLDMHLCTIQISDEIEKDYYVRAVIEINDLLLDRRSAWSNPTQPLFNKETLLSKLPSISLEKLQGYRAARLSIYKAEEKNLYTLYEERVTPKSNED